MPNKLFIGNLSFSITEDGLNELFAGAGIPIANVKLMRDQETGRSRGFAFVELAPEADMESAISQLNGKVLEGRPLTVNEARQQKPRSFGGGGGGGGFDRNRNRFGQRSGPRGSGGGRDNRQRRGF
ncbi:MAG: RNA-binding protein [Acidobacteriota bacterium]|nr:RNA-binding protein [Acidobacteriota bacterium]